MGVVATGQLTLYDANDPTSSQFVEFWDGDWASRWVNYAGSGEMSVAADSTLPAGALALTIGNNSGNDMVWLIAKQNIPFDSNKLYKLTFYVKRPAGTGTTYLGVAGVASDGVTWVNFGGTNTPTSNQHYIAGAGLNPGSSFAKYVGYIKGTAATGTTSACPTPESPGKLHTNCKYFRPLMIVNYSAVAGTTVVGAVTVEVMPEFGDIPYGTSTYNLAVASDSQLTAMASDSIITPQEKTGVLGRWCEWYNDSAATSALPTAPTTDGRYKRIVDTATSVSGWTPTTAGTASKAFYDALEALRAYLFGTPGVILASTWANNINITKATWLSLWMTAEATAQALEGEVAGKQGLTANLSNDSHLVPTDADGNNGTFTGCATTMSIYRMGVDDSANWTVTASPSTGVTGSLSGKTYTVTAMSVDAGYIDLTATRSGYPSLTVRFTVVKAKGGASYWLVSSADAVQKSQTGVYTPSTITFTGKRSASAGVIGDYSGRFVIAETTDGASYTDKYTSSANETSKTYTPSAGIKALRCRLYLAGGTSTLLDEEIIPIVVDGPTGPTGPQGPTGPTGPQGPAGANGQDAPRYLGVYSYANSGTITGMIAGDLVVLYSSTQSERGIYAYVSSTWTKQTTPTQDQIMRCMVGVLDAVRQGYGQSSDYIGTGATSFETLLVNFLYAQYAMITGSIRAGTRYDQNGSEVNPSQEGVWIGANGKIKGAINDVEPDQVTPSFTRRQLFTASGTWTIPAHVKWVRVTAMGGGGGGGGSGGATDGGSQSASTVYNGNNGSAGGASSFGSYVTANGGAGGSGSGGAGTGASGQNGGSSDYIGGYNGANGATGSAAATFSAANTGTRTSGTGGVRGSSAGLYDSTVELSNASGSLTKTPSISAGASKTNSASISTGTVVSNGATGNAGTFGGGGGGATGGCFAVKSIDDAYAAAGACGGGGGAGALRQRVCRINEVYGQTTTVTVGAGGAGGTAGGGTTATGAAGGNGGTGWVLVEW